MYVLDANNILLHPLIMECNKCTLPGVFKLFLMYWLVPCIAATAISVCMYELL